jgi:DNA-3-methyladenine glycosylase II
MKAQSGIHMTPHYWHEATQYLQNSCEVMHHLIARYPDGVLISRGDAFYTLMRSIVGQQISVKAADAVWAKLEGCVQPLTPQKLLRVRETTLRSCGLSAQKVSYTKNLARFFVERGIDIPPPACGGRSGGGIIHESGEVISPLPSSPRKQGEVKERFSPSTQAEAQYFSKLTDAEIITELTSIKGIGVWTAEMFLIFHLQRPDIFPLQDIGMIKAIEKHCADGKKLARADIIAYGERWRPYRTVATWYLWRSLDPVPVAY